MFNRVFGWVDGAQPLVGTSTLREVANYYNEHNDDKKVGFFLTNAVNIIKHLTHI